MDKFPLMSSSASEPEALLAHAAWIRRLARALVNDGDPAMDFDDIEQQTWLAALRSSRMRTADEPANPRGWLRAVARNVARRFARDHAARQRREESAAPDEALAPADDAVARAELHGKVVAAVVALGEPYRSTLIRRFLDEKSPSQIAALDQVPVETVKTRLKRGLALLRDRFASELGEQDGDERDWRRALLGLYAPGAAEGSLLLGSGPWSP
jgi:RNA polymerase sigma-70 factor (ECF subfamily)